MREGRDPTRTLLQLKNRGLIRRSSQVVRDLEDNFGLDLTEYQRARADE